MGCVLDIQELGIYNQNISQQITPVVPTLDMSE